MRKRSKLKKIYPLSPSIQSKLASIKSDLISSHQKCVCVSDTGSVYGKN